MLKWWHKDRWTTILTVTYSKSRLGINPLPFCVYKLHFTYIYILRKVLVKFSLYKRVSCCSELSDLFSSLLLKGTTHCHILLWSTVLTDIYYSTEWMNQSGCRLLRFPKQGLCYGKLWRKLLHTGSVNFFYKGPELAIVLWVCKRISLPSGNTHRYWGIFIFAIFVSVNLF